MGVAPVGFGLAAWMQPFDAQLPHATMTRWRRRPLP